MQILDTRRTGEQNPRGEATEPIVVNMSGRLYYLRNMDRLSADQAEELKQLLETRKATQGAKLEGELKRLQKELERLQNMPLPTILNTSRIAMPLEGQARK